MASAPELPQYQNRWQKFSYKLNVINDKIKKQTIEAKNDADSLAYSTEKSLEEHKDKLQPADVEDIKSQIAALRKAAEGDDLEDIKAKISDLQKAAMKIGDAMYKNSGGAQEEPKDEKVVDAEFKEKKDQFA